MRHEYVQHFFIGGFLRIVLATLKSGSLVPFPSSNATGTGTFCGAALPVPLRPQYPPDTNGLTVDSCQSNDMCRANCVCLTRLFTPCNLTAALHDVSFPVPYN